MQLDAIAQNHIYSDFDSRNQINRSHNSLKASRKNSVDRQIDDRSQFHSHTRPRLLQKSARRRAIARRHRRRLSKAA